MDSIEVLGLCGMVFETEPTELVATGAGHVRAPGDALDGDLAFGALVGHEDEVDETEDGFEGGGLGDVELGRALGAEVVDACGPFALLCSKHKVTTLRRTLLNILCECGILLIQQLFYLVLI